jgi:hypothetical protein
MARLDQDATMGNETAFVNDDKVASIFQTDTLLSKQYFDTFRRNSYLEPEKRLMLAILEDAISCYQDNYISRTGKKKRFFDEVREWIVSADGDWVFSFEHVCDALGLNAAYIRRGLLQWKPNLGVVHAGESQRMAG